MEALGLEQGVVDGLNPADAVHLETGGIDGGHFGQGAHEPSVVVDAQLGGLARRGVLVAGFAPGKHQRGGHALQVPLEGSADGLIEVVDVEDEAAVGRGKCAQVADVGIAADLGEDAGIGQAAQVGGHHGNGAAEIAEGRLGHELPLELDQRRDAAAGGMLEEFDRRL